MMKHKGSFRVLDPNPSQMLVAALACSSILNFSSFPPWIQGQKGQREHLMSFPLWFKQDPKKMKLHRTDRLESEQRIDPSASGCSWYAVSCMTLISCKVCETRRSATCERTRKSSNLLRKTCRILSTSTLKVSDIPKINIFDRFLHCSLLVNIFYCQEKSSNF